MKRYIHSSTPTNQAKTYVEEYTYQAWDNYNDDPNVNLTDVVNIIVGYIEEASEAAEEDGEGVALHLGKDFTKHDIRNEMRNYEWTVGKKSRKLTGSVQASNSLAFEYTDFISEEIPEAVQVFLDSDDSSYPEVKAACDAFWEDYKKFPSLHSMDILDIKYDKDKARFYKKYRLFADACRKLDKTISPSGYGRLDYVQFKIKDLLRAVDYNFPYGWKNL